MIRSQLFRLLSILAIVGMVAVPVVAPAGAGMVAAVSMAEPSDMAMSDMDMSDAAMSDDMPCCPSQQQQQTPDCGKATCPSMALCFAKCFSSGPPAAVVRSLPIHAGKLFGLKADTRLASLAPPPLMRPPRI
ncbi:hypothetical protein KHC23_20925 [Ancylobacter dichloromethanicus]|uniref:CopL family metal-binding regulatory protein n=1 Tax=Ancylobacter dichloromethanicus TaxID=518825 RepID=A0A9W6N0Q8_9HYPH|nr:hypothetical protein [Ancylobacter dichloromethanicus]MBS7556098.1 hypothetical protein [Ancylobacter dichloromethanicus]GLK73438.1 hypothetical protein GCM10017643_35550 [Ancylobacter dichloromethanicus]